MEYDRPDTATGHLETALVLCFGVAAVGYGLARLTDVISYTLPGPVYLLAGVLLMLWGISLVWRR